MAQLTKEEKVLKSMNLPKEIDLSVNFRIPRATFQFNPKEHKFKCTCCGKGYNTQAKVFQKSPSVLFQANDGYLPWCKECTDKYFTLLTAFYSNNEEHAMEHFCQQVDWVYDAEPLKASLETSYDRTRVSVYASKKNLNVSGRKTFLDTLRYNFQTKPKEIIESREQVKSEEVSVTASAVDRWGLGFSEIDYKILDEHYKMLKKNNPNCDNNQEIFVKSLCNINMLMVRALKDGDSDKYVKLTEQYSKTFTKAGLKTVVEADKNADDCWGLFMEQISQYTPEEYYKDKKLYEDFDKIGELFERFVLRPLKNIMFKTNERDPEYNVEGVIND